MSNNLPMNFSYKYILSVYLYLSVKLRTVLFVLVPNLSEASHLK